MSLATNYGFFVCTLYTMNGRKSGMLNFPALIQNEKKNLLSTGNDWGKMQGVMYVGRMKKEENLCKKHSLSLNVGGAVETILQRRYDKHSVNDFETTVRQRREQQSEKEWKMESKESTAEPTRKGGRDDLCWKIHMQLFEA